jgi:hypothetical protein
VPGTIDEGTGGDPQSETTDGFPFFLFNPHGFEEGDLFSPDSLDE